VQEPPLLVLENVTVRFPGGHSALRGVTLSVARGERLVLLGRSGAGKSTLLRCLNLLQRPTTGSVRVSDLDDLAEPRVLREHRRRTGMVFQDHHLIGRRTALQNVLTGRLGFHSPLRSILPLPAADVRLAMECLDRVGMADKALRRADRLSGGERQRVGIARALVQGPRLLLADEPVASLDPATAEQILDLLVRICREDGLTAVLSLHQVDLARMYGDRILGLARGEVVFDGLIGDLGEGPMRRIYRRAGEGEAGAPPAGRGGTHDAGANGRRVDDGVAIRTD
jgi:phosphonate transport system ATP-binding protein